MHVLLYFGHFYSVARGFLELYLNNLSLFKIYGEILIHLFSSSNNNLDIY